MASYSGKDGTLTFNSLLVKITNWQLSVADTSPSTAHSGSAGWAESWPGSRSWSGTAAFLKDDTADNTPTTGTRATIALNDGIVTRTGTAVISGVNPVCDVATGAFVGGTITFIGSGALT